jgi:glyoxylase I family protein
MPIVPVEDLTVLNAINHVALICTNYEQSKRFYVEILGLELEREIYREDRQSWKGDLRIGTAYIELFSFPAPALRSSYPEATGLRHLAFGVTHRDPVIEQLTGLGIAVEPAWVDPHTGHRFTSVSDPDGLPLELYEG